MHNGYHFAKEENILVLFVVSVAILYYYFAFKNIPFIIDVHIESLIAEGRFIVIAKKEADSLSKLNE